MFQLLLTVGENWSVPTSPKNSSFYFSGREKSGNWIIGSEKVLIFVICDVISMQLKLKYLLSYQLLFQVALTKSFVAITVDLEGHKWYYNRS